MNKRSLITIRIFAFLGPIGNLISFPGLHSFRLFYVVSFVGIIVLAGSTKKIFKKQIIIDYLFAVPFFFYACLSILWYQAPIDYSDSGISDNPILRILLLITLYTFCLLSTYNIGGFTERIKCLLVKDYIFGYIISLFAGYLFQIGYNIGILSLDFISNFQVIADISHAGLRFSPGSYPNEYGNVSSFVLSVLILLIFNFQRTLLPADSLISKNFLIQKLTILALFTFFALYLSTTRTAYFSFFVSLVFVISLSRNIIKILKDLLIVILLSMIFFVPLVMYLKALDIDLLYSLLEGYGLIFSGEGSAGMRYESWTQYFYEFSRHPFFGIGYGSTSTLLHSNYFQIIFELGIFGTILCLVAMYPFLKRIYFFSLNKTENFFFKNFVTISLIHILIFSASNHSFNHHLTWFGLMLAFPKSNDDPKTYFSHDLEKPALTT